MSEITNDLLLRNQYLDSDFTRVSYLWFFIFATKLRIGKLRQGENV